MDGTHVSCIPPSYYAERYRNRHATLSHNVLAVVSFDMQFTYIMSGVEGFAHDSRVLKLAMLDQDNQFPIPPDGELFITLFHQCCYDIYQIFIIVFNIMNNRTYLLFVLNQGNTIWWTRGSLTEGVFLHHIVHTHTTYNNLEIVHEGWAPQEKCLITLILHCGTWLRGLLAYGRRNFTY